MSTFLRREPSEFCASGSPAKSKHSSGCKASWHSENTKHQTTTPAQLRLNKSSTDINRLCPEVSKNFGCNSSIGLCRCSNTDSQGSVLPSWPKHWVTWGKTRRELSMDYQWILMNYISVYRWSIDPCSKCLPSWHQIRKWLLTPLLTFCLRAYLVLRRAYAGLCAPQFCLRHTLTRGPLLNMNTRV